MSRDDGVNWTRMYLLVLGELVALVIIFYLISRWAS